MADIPSPEQVKARIDAIERLGNHGSMPGYWREPLSVALAAYEVSLDDAEAEADRYEEVLRWLRENNPQALELCPYKVTL